MASIVVFLGPTLDRESATRVLPATYLPPVSQGEVLSAAQSKPSAIAIIDGYFDRVPAVWHKEVLWALESGIPVFGSSSMGALRAAELAAFGMIGVGRIFSLYRDGVYEDDDEVAIAHASEERDYRPLSDAMVNIRATLEAAVRHETLSIRSSATMLEMAKRLHYSQRSYGRLLKLADTAGVPAAELDKFKSWLATGKVDQKRLDAIELLATLERHSRSEWPSVKPGFALSRTDAWEQLRRQVGVEHVNGPSPLTLQFETLVDELILSESLPNAQNGAASRALALALGTRTLAPAVVDAQAMQATEGDFRATNQLLTTEAFERWLRDQRLTDPEAFTRFFTDEAIVRRSLATYAADLAPHLLGYLRASGAFPAIADRVERKLTAFGGQLPKSWEESGQSEAELWTWFFQQRGRQVPRDLGAYVRVIHGVPAERVLTSISRDYCYQRTIHRSAHREGEGCDTPSA